MVIYYIMRGYLYDVSTDKCSGFVPEITKVFLFILSLLYGLIIRVLSFLSSQMPTRLPCKVISVGNITLGGTGKTTLVEYIAKDLLAQGHKVAILTRGYKRKHPKMHSEKASHETMGDEPYMLQRNLQGVAVIVDADRVRGAKKAISEHGVDTIILDDGFQQWAIQKDLEIVVVDATNPFGNRHMIPRGILREPLDCLKRADVLMLTKVNLAKETRGLKDFLSQLNPDACIVESQHCPAGLYALNKETSSSIDLATLKGKAVAIFSGIGDPDSFERLISSLGINIGLILRFDDHHNYTSEDLEKIVQSSRDKDIEHIITTEKDAVRLSGLQISFLRIELKITQNEQGFVDRLHRLYRA